MFTGTNSVTVPWSVEEKSIHAYDPDGRPLFPASYPGVPVNLHPSPLIAL